MYSTFYIVGEFMAYEWETYNQQTDNQQEKLACLRKNIVYLTEILMWCDCQKLFIYLKLMYYWYTFGIPQMRISRTESRKETYRENLCCGLSLFVLAKVTLPRTILVGPLHFLNLETKFNKLCYTHLKVTGKLFFVILKFF